MHPAEGSHGATKDELMYFFAAESSNQPCSAGAVLQGQTQGKTNLCSVRTRARFCGVNLSAPET